MTEAQKKSSESNRLTSEARYAALIQLAANHKEEFDRLYAIAAAARGIKARPR